MNYRDLINPDYIVPKEHQLYAHYRLKRTFSDDSFFIHFRSWNWDEQSIRKIETNWKARLSVHKEDIEQAWEIIFPLLYNYEIPFKIANQNVVENNKKGREEKLTNLIDEYDQFVRQSNNQTISSLKETYSKLAQHFNEFEYTPGSLMSLLHLYISQFTIFIKQCFLSKNRQVEDINNDYETLIKLGIERVINSSRFYEGMQFTIYISPGLEKKYQSILEIIEEELIARNIRPGKIHANDRQIGLFSSIRHPGKWFYHKAIDPRLETYNPNHLEDPFDFISTLSKNEVAQETDIEDILKQENNAERIISLLRTKKYIPPRYLKVLATHKEQVLQYIKNSPRPNQTEYIRESLDKATNLGTFFRVKHALHNKDYISEIRGQIRGQVYL